MLNHLGTRQDYGILTKRRNRLLGDIFPSCKTFIDKIHSVSSGSLRNGTSTNRREAFLHGNLVEYIVMEQPEEVLGKKIPNKVCKLTKSLYGVKQSLKHFNEFIRAKGCIRSKYDQCVYFKNVKSGDYIYICYYMLMIFS